MDTCTMNVAADRLKSIFSPQAACQALPAGPVLERENHFPRGVVHEAPAGLVLAQALCVVALPSDCVVDALLAFVAQLVQLDVVLDEGVGEQAEHQQHERLRRAVQHGAEAPPHHHEHLLARGEAELDGGRDQEQRSDTKVSAVRG